LKRQSNGSKELRKKLKKVLDKRNFEAYNKEVVSQRHTVIEKRIVP